MKINLNKCFIVLLIAFCAVIQTSTAQGPLAPAGAPAPVMKSLDQVEPRTPISDSPYPITQAGSYYLTTNLVAQPGENGIRVSTNNVTIDLNGFSLIGCPGSWSGIAVASGSKDLIIRNGIIRGWEYGVQAPNSGIRLENLIAATNLVGLQVGTDCIIVQCVARENGHGIETGDRCLITDTVASCNKANGIKSEDDCSIIGVLAASNISAGIVADFNCRIADTSAINNGHGIDVRSDSLVERSIAIGNNGVGIAVGNGSVVRNCNSSTNSGDGIWAMSGCLLTDNHCDSNAGAGIHVTERECRIDENNVSNNGSGIDVDGDRNFIVRNSARDNGGLNYVIVAGNRVGIIVTPPLSGAISGDTSATNALGVATTDPWANFMY